MSLLKRLLKPIAATDRHTGDLRSLYDNVCLTAILACPNRPNFRTRIRNQPNGRQGDDAQQAGTWLAYSPVMLDESMNEWLRGLLDRHGAIAGTVHLVRGDALEITAAHNIPPKVQEVTARIPLGKGMAGLAWQHDRPVSTCNLQEDASGAVKPGAKAVDGKAAVALPVHDPSGMIRAVVGLAWADERELPEALVARIAGDAASL